MYKKYSQSELINIAENIFRLKKVGNRFHCPVNKDESGANVCIYKGKFKCWSCGESWYPDQLAEKLGIPFESDYTKHKRIRKSNRDSEPASQVNSDLTSFAGERIRTSKAGSVSSEQTNQANKAEIKFLLERSVLIDDSQQEKLDILYRWRGWSYKAIKLSQLRYLPRQSLMNIRKFVRWKVWLNDNSLGWLLFPYIDANNEVVYMKGKQLADKAEHKENNAKGSLPFPFGYHQLDLNKEIWVFEGEADAISGLTLGFNCVGISGANLKDDWLHLFKGCKVKMCFDIDPHGKKGAENAIKGLKKVCKSLVNKKITEFKNYTTGKDLNDYLLSLLPCDDARKVMLPEGLLLSWLNADDSQREAMLERFCYMRTEGVNEKEIIKQLVKVN